MEVSTFDAKNTLSALLDRVEQGEEVTITRRGKPVAKLVSAHAAETQKEAARRAVRAIIDGGKGFTLGGLKIRDLIDEGRH